jgi:hypothetical protein
LNLFAKSEISDSRRTSNIDQKIITNGQIWIFPVDTNPIDTRIPHPATVQLAEQRRKTDRFEQGTIEKHGLAHRRNGRTNFEPNGRKICALVEARLADSLNR